MSKNKRYFWVKIQRQYRYKCIDWRFFWELRFWLFKTTENIPAEWSMLIKWIHINWIRFFIRFPMIFILFK